MNNYRYFGIANFDMQISILYLISGNVVHQQIKFATISIFMLLIDTSLNIKLFWNTSS
jgi:hypothetical protein